VTAPLLVLEDVAAFYGAVPALFDVSLDVGEGEIVALLGPNGAGKSTTLRAISGVVKAVGSITFGGRRIDGLSPDVVARLGIAHVPEGRGLFPSLTVQENLKLGTFVAPDRSTASADTDRVFEIFPVLRERISQVAGTLSGGEQQMLAVGRALVSRPRLLLVDELSLGLAPPIVERLFAIIPQIAASGTAVLLVEQFVGHALRVASRAFVLERGNVSWSGASSALARRKDFVEASYLGTSRKRTRADEPASVAARVAVPVPVRELRALQREAAASGSSVEELLAARLSPDGNGSRP